MRLVIVSNRLPFAVAFREKSPRFKPSNGGMATGLWSYLKRQAGAGGELADFLWLGWPGDAVEPEHREAVRNYARKEFKALPIFLPEESNERFYRGFCNRTLWPIFHYFPTLARYDPDDWKEYRRVNELFATAVAEVLQPDDVVWVQDYQLMLLPRLLREQFPEVPIGFFLHIPFPSYEVFRLLPRAWRIEIVEGLLGANLVGFHTHDYTRDFLTSVLRTAGYEHQLGRLTVRDRVVKVDTFPMGIDFERFAGAAASSQTLLRVDELKKQYAGQSIVFSVDRLDYTKGLINRLRGYDLFLKTNPHWRGKVVFLLSVAPSRTGIESYQSMRQELEQTVGRIIGTHGTVSWTPLIYQYRNVGFEELVAMYRLCDVALITPLRDGMNLVAKEFVSSRPDGHGVLILSEMAGAAKEMSEALVINPFHINEVAVALEQALQMPAEEQVRRNQLLQERLRRYNVCRWAEDFVQSLREVQSTEAAHRALLLTGRAQAGVIQQFASAPRRALLLDYDGTLIPFAQTPTLARPDKELIELLVALSQETENELAIISGRPRASLEEWFGDLRIALIAEHGVWLRAKDAPWRALKTITTEWKERVRPILQFYVDRLPGALLEEKEFSLAWHYRRADPEEALVRARELLDTLADYTRNIDLQVLEGDKVLEVRSTGITKGIAANEWLSAQTPGFILAIGDDWTDEELFRALPATACTVRVGLAQTAARYHLGNPAAVRRMLRSLLSVSRKKASAPADPETAASLGRAAEEAAPAPQESQI